MRQAREFDIGSSALLIVDMQRKFTDSTDGMRSNIEPRLPVINAAIGRFRDEGRPVFYIGYGGRCEYAPDVSDEDAFTYGMLQPRPVDRIYWKHTMNSFHEPDLAGMLRALGCTDVLICGTVAQYCVLATYFGAFDSGFEPYLLKGGISAKDASSIDAVESIARTVVVERGGVPPPGVFTPYGAGSAPAGPSSSCSTPASCPCGGGAGSRTSAPPPISRRRAAS